MKNANEIAMLCKTCKDAETYYKEMIENGLSKEDAKSIIKEAKSIINARKENARTEKKGVSEWFANFEEIGKSIAIGFVKGEFRGCKEEFSKFETVSDFIGYWVTKADSLNQPIRKEKGEWVYKTISANNVRSVLCECFRNIVASQYGQEVKFVRIETSEIRNK